MAIAIIFTISAFAQSNTGIDHRPGEGPERSAVANATVTVTNLGTNEKRTVQTNDEGFYEAAVAFDRRLQGRPRQPAASRKRP